MDSREIGLKCLELALTQARMEGQHGSIDRVAEIQTRFYNLIIPEPETDPEPARKKPKADKAPKIFE